MQNSTIIVSCETPNNQIPNVPVFLDLANSGIPAGQPASTTNLRGNAYFTGLNPGTYIVRQVIDKSFMLMGGKFEQIVPSIGLGIHVTVADNAEVTVTFHNLATPAQPAQPVQPVQPVQPAQPSQPAQQSNIAFNIGSAPNVQLVAQRLASTGSKVKRIVRWFSFGGFGLSALPPVLKVASGLLAEGVNSCLCVNFEDGLPTLPLYQAWIDALPTSAESGISMIEFGNELNGMNGDHAYFPDGPTKSAKSGTPSQYKALWDAGFQKLKAKGYTVVLGNITSYTPNSSGKAFYDGLNTLGLFTSPNKPDGAGGHFYNSNDTNSKAQHLALMAFLAPFAIMYICTEFGLHSSMPAWIAYMVALLEWAITIPNSLFFYFPLFVTTSAAGPQGIYKPDGTINDPIGSAVLAVLK